MHMGYAERGWLSTVMLFLVAGCGGGGSGGGSGGGLPALQYSGNSNAAVISATNASKLVSSVLGGEDASVVAGGLAITDSGSTQGVSRRLSSTTRTLQRASRATLTRTNRTRLAAGITINETEPCDGGVGSTRTTGTLSDIDGTGTLSVVFTNCLLDGNTLNGQATVQVHMVNLSLGLPTDFTTSFSRVNVRGPGINFDVGGSLRLQVNLGTNTEIMTENSVTLNNLTGEMRKTENLVSMNSYDNVLFPSSVVSSMTGRAFDGVHGYVDVSTLVPLFFADLNQLFPGSGQVLLTGSGNRAIRVMALSATNVTLALDLDGNGVFEASFNLKWTDLSGPVGDLSDTDGDGMHNGWETAHGLNPNNPADAFLDNDGDTASNLSEYRAGSNPNDASSTPPLVGLMVSMEDTPDPVTQGATITYSIVVSNLNAVATTNVVVSDNLPGNVSFVSAVPTQGSCTGTSAVVCNIGTLNPFGSASIVIQVVPTSAGLVHNSANVTSGTFDPNLADNTATSTTTVADLATGIQALINAAADGATILIDPGIYTGNLNFNGKNITLQSRDGPATTILHGNSEVAVRMGPGGAVKGFTITGGLSGIVVTGSGSLISGNVFDGNTQIPGGFASGIDGNSASPTIERNIFRNNSCPTVQTISGVVAFFNTSSPVIRNNVFENNQCRAINLTLPTANVPQVINNTFFGNLSAIRVDRRVSQTTQIFRNNLIAQNGTGFEVEFGTDAANPVWQNNLVFGNTVNYQGTADQTGTNGNITSDPLFINGASGNYRLQTSPVVSPAVNAGSAVGAPVVDFDGTARPIGGNWDIGAFEAP